MKRVFGILSLGLILAGANYTYAQDRPTDDVKKQPRVVTAEKKERPQLTAEQKQKLAEERKASFAKELDLTEKEADKYFQIQKDYRSKFQKLHEEQRKLRTGLKSADQLSDKDLKKDLERLNAIDVEIAKLKADKFDKEVSAIGIRKVTKAQELSHAKFAKGPKGPKRFEGQKPGANKVRKVDAERSRPTMKADAQKLPKPVEK